MDKRRYVSRDPRNPRTPIGMATDETGSAAADGYTVRSRKPLERPDFSRDSRYGENHASDGLMNEDEARFKTLYGDD